MRKQIPPMTRPSLIKARVLCFLRGEGSGHRPYPSPECSPGTQHPRSLSCTQCWKLRSKNSLGKEEEAQGAIGEAGEGVLGRGCFPRDLRVEDEAGDVLLGHSRQLVGEDVLQPHQPQQHPPVGLGCERVANDVEFDDASALFQASSLVPGGVGRQQARLGTRGGSGEPGSPVVSPRPTGW